MKFQEIPQFSKANYGVDVSLLDVEEHLQRFFNRGLELVPDFQRGHVWTQEQQERFIEFLLKGGKTSAILFNHEGWMKSFEGEFVCVDGLQRLTAIRRFLAGEVSAFGYTIDEYEDSLPYTLTIRFEVNNLPTRKEVLQWYVDLNDGGTVHSDEEIARVRAMIE